MSKVKPVFEANDGSKHASAAAAERHNALLKARDEFEQAAKKLGRRLGEMALTADGQPFDLSNSRHYWRIRNFCGYLGIEELWVWPHNAYVDTDREGASLCVRWFEGASDKYRSAPIGELYTTEKAAKAALVGAYAERIKELQEEAAKLTEQRQ